jgi:hypothetical protein
MSKRHEYPGIDLEEFSFPGLIFLLRHKELWPKRFKWDFLNCNKCAMGLIHKQWFPEIAPRKFYSWGVEDGAVFTLKNIVPLRGPFLYGACDKTPEQVADELERLTNWSD